MNQRCFIHFICRVFSVENIVGKKMIKRRWSQEKVCLCYIIYCIGFFYFEYTNQLTCSDQIECSYLNRYRYLDVAGIWEGTAGQIRIQGYTSRRHFISLYQHVIATNLDHTLTLSLGFLDIQYIDRKMHPNPALTTIGILKAK